MLFAWFFNLALPKQEDLNSSEDLTAKQQSDAKSKFQKYIKFTCETSRRDAVHDVTDDASDSEVERSDSFILSPARSWNENMSLSLLAKQA